MSWHIQFNLLFVAKIVYKSCVPLDIVGTFQFGNQTLSGSRSAFQHKMQSTIGQPTSLKLSGTNSKTILAAQNSSEPKTEGKPQKQIQHSLFLALSLSLAIAGLMFVAWFGGVFASLQTIVLFFNAPLTAPPMWAAAIILAVAAGFTATLVGRGNSTRNIYFLGGFIILYLVGGAAAAHLAAFDILAVPTIFAVVLTALVNQIFPLLRLNRDLSVSLNRVAMTPHFLEGKRADARLTGSLQVLSTVLPLEETVVFQLTKKGELIAVGRNRENSDKFGKPQHAEWREGVELCDESLKTGLPVVQKLAGTAPNAARVAVPLIHENLIIGALLVRFRENYEVADNVVLTAFAAQLARNFQRQEARQNERQAGLFDLFSRRAAEQQLESFRVVSGLLTEQQFGSLAFAEMVDGYAIAYLDGTLAYINRAMMKAAQITADRARQLDLFELLERFKGGVFDEPRIAVRRVMQTGEPYRHEIFLEERNQALDLQITLIHQPGEGKAVHETLVQNATPLCFIITVRDVTAQKENERLRSDMVSLMSHELRTPITSINGFAELLMLDDNIGEESKEFLRIISTESQRLSRMLSTFLAVSKLEQGDKREVVKIPIRLDSVVHEVLLDIQPAARKKRIRLVEQANAHLPPVAGDKGLMIKVVTHLVDNAIKYSPERTTITVSTVLEADSVRVIVEDRGYGIPSDSLEKIWEKFYRVPRDGQDKNETSTGLGLSYVKEVVEQHGGAVFIESEPNQGSKFSFTLPRL